MTDEIIPSKWIFIATWLTNLNAPKKVINAAIEINNALIGLGLGDNTEDWEEDYGYILGWNRTSCTALYDLIMNGLYCTACEDCGNICCHCKLGVDGNCTPRHRYADEYFPIVKSWIKKNRNIEKCASLNVTNIQI